MLKSNRVIFVLAIIMAIILWAYVLGEVDPVRTITIKDIPIKLLNESTLSDDDLIITDMDSTVTSVTFSAKRSVANKIEEKDFNATANLRGVTQGDNIVEVNVTRPSNIVIESISTEHINVKTDKLITAVKDIEVVFINEDSEDTEAKILRLSDESVKVTGAASIVSDVEKVIAKVDATRLTTEPNSISAELEAVDKNNYAVEDVELYKKTVSVTAILKYLKTVPLEVTVTGKESGSVSRGYSAPDKIIIKGSEEVLEGIESISCESVDISDLYESKSINLVPILPDGVELSADNPYLIMDVAVYNAGVGEFVFNETNVNIVGIDEKSSITIHEVEIKVTVKGTATAVNSLTEDDFILSADASDLTTGTHTVELEVVTDDTGLDSIEFRPHKITIDVKK
ncbi:MAG: hypothetical protein IKS99_05965 [Firmicutes bacterium]|nr:hypothetical protein [Bacillota bacterium]